MYNFAGETKTSTGKEQLQGGEKFKLELGDETNFLTGHPPHLGGESFQRGRYWGYSNTCSFINCW